ncbi:polymerase protein [Hovenia dulcis-associated virus 2]|nr:polymerase protein [Hovenia dulcis-associated virus 2]
MIPARLAGPLVPDGPMLKAISKNSSNTFPLSHNHILGDIKSEYFSKCIATFIPQPIEQTVLDFRQACQGIEGNQYIPPIKRGKSAGYPYCTMAKKGKTDWFGDQEWDFSSKACKDLRRDVHNLIEDARHGIVPEAVFIATLKDEKRPVEKVLQNKTRVFSACPQHFLIAFRQYFAGFIAFMCRNKIWNESAIGTNCHGFDWKEIVRYLTPWNVQNIASGDFENFDGSFHPEIFDLIVDIINDFYQDSSDNRRIRTALWKALKNPLHLLDMFIFTFSHGQPSGSPITAISNSMYVSLCVRYILYDLLKQLGLKFTHHVRVLAYGDDLLLSISPELSKHLTPFMIAQLFKERIRMTYTTAFKRPFQEDDQFEQIQDVSFLKRGFAYDDNRKHWFAPLELRSIREMCNWIKKSPSVMQATIDNCNDAMKELCHHDSVVFEEYRDKILSACHNTGMLLEVPDWDRVRTTMSLGQIDYLSEGRPFV